MRTMIPAATRSRPPPGCPSSRCSRARERSVSSSSAARVATAAPAALGLGRLEGARADLVAGPLDRRHELGPADPLGEVADRGDLRGEVDAGLLDAVGLAQEPLDPVAARGAGHADDREGDLHGTCGAGGVGAARNGCGGSGGVLA